MLLSVKNLAQIQKADSIVLKDFNVFIGKNGTGKTYFSKLIYFLNSSKYKEKLFEKLFLAKLTLCFENHEDATFSIEEQKKFIIEYKNSIKSSFAEFIGSKKELFKDFDFEYKIDNKLENIVISYDENIDTIRAYISLSGFEFIEKLFGIVESYYLPAARANYMITYKYLFESQFNDFRELFLNKSTKKRISIFPEVENNFLKDIYQVDTNKHGELYKFGYKIEKSIFKNGKLSIKNPKSQDLPTYEYKINDLKKSIDLIVASSSVTELSPLIMYFRHKILNAKTEMLIIDEPELSLHPDAQSVLVSILVEAVNVGLKIILVTHSPYIVEALNNHLQRDKIKDCDLPKEIKEFEAIDADKVGAYLFEENSIIDIVDKEEKLIDDKLLNSFNTINDIYDSMRDIEWDNESD